MDPNTRSLVMGAAGGAGAEKLYVEDVFSTYLYTGNGSTQTITNGIDLSGKGGLVWLKARTAATAADHVFADTTRGASNYLSSNTTSAQIDDSSNINGFTSSGFSVNLGARVNQNANNYVSWTFRKAAKFFDVVTYTGNGVFGRSITHNLGSIPGCIIVKRTDTTGQWLVYHRSTGASAYLLLNSTNAVATGSSVWNDASPTSTSFQVASSSDLNANGGTYVAYLFAHDAGGFGDSGNESIINCGSFTTGPGGLPDFGIVDLPWEPQWLLVKLVDSSQGWILVDNLRGFSRYQQNILRPNTQDAEISGLVEDSLFPAPRGIGIEQFNWFSGGSTYIYVAIRRGPMKKPTDATKVYNALTAVSSDGTLRTVGFPADLNIGSRRTENLTGYVQDRIRGFNNTNSTGIPILQTSNLNAEQLGQNPFAYEVWNNTARDGGQGGGSSSVWHYFRRAPGFFDVVAYKGTGTTLNVTHNLEAVPELIIAKRRKNAGNWVVYSAALGASQYLTLNNPDPADGSSAFWGGVNPTSSTFTVGTALAVNTAGERYISYLFASCPGVSKVGSYTGNGSTQDIDCGFTNGARFVLIKRTNGTDGWYLYDSARGIISGNDPFLLLNQSSAENGGTDLIDPLSTGFRVDATNITLLNASGIQYIYLAIA